MFILFGIIFLAFPKSTPGAVEMRRKAIEAGDIKPRDSEIDCAAGFKGFVYSTISMFRNKVLLCAALALAAKTSAISGTVGFLVKLFVVKYGASPKVASFTIGFMLTIGSASKLHCFSIVSHV